jgi:hypothetical protein
LYLKSLCQEITKGGTWGDGEDLGRGKGDRWQVDILCEGLSNFWLSLPRERVQNSLVDSLGLETLRRGGAMVHGRRRKKTPAGNQHVCQAVLVLLE